MSKRPLDPDLPSIPPKKTKHQDNHPPAQDAPVAHNEEHWSETKYRSYPKRQWMKAYVTTFECTNTEAELAWTDEAEARARAERAYTRALGLDFKLSMPLAEEIIAIINSTPDNDEECKRLLCIQLGEAANLPSK
jgi:hypothetical protein